jgi:hypothetical protein
MDLIPPDLQPVADAGFLPSAWPDAVGCGESSNRIDRGLKRTDSERNVLQKPHMTDLLANTPLHDRHRLALQSAEVCERISRQSSCTRAGRTRRDRCGLPVLTASYATTQH